MKSIKEKMLDMWWWLSQNEVQYGEDDYYFYLQENGRENEMPPAGVFCWACYVAGNECKYCPLFPDNRKGKSIETCHFLDKYWREAIKNKDYEEAKKYALQMVDLIENGDWDEND